MKLARAILGPDVDNGLLTRLASDFEASGLQLRPLARAIVEAGLDANASGPLVAAPVPWLVAMAKATGAASDELLSASGKGLLAAGRVPMDAPNVAGWPGGRNWLSSSATVARFNLAGGVAVLTPDDSTFRHAAQSGDTTAMAEDLGHPSGFDDATKAAIDAAKGKDKNGELAMTLAMSSPDAVVL
jgi:uncharacterized protein (DUF1800 family)